MTKGVWFPGFRALWQLRTPVHPPSMLVSIQSSMMVRCHYDLTFITPYLTASLANKREVPQIKSLKRPTRVTVMDAPDSDDIDEYSYGPNDTSSHDFASANVPPSPRPSPGRSQSSSSAPLPPPILRASSSRNQPVSQFLPTTSPAHTIVPLSHIFGALHVFLSEANRSPNYKMVVYFPTVAYARVAVWVLLALGEIGDVFGVGIPPNSMPTGARLGSHHEFLQARRGVFIVPKSGFSEIQGSTAVIEVGLSPLLCPYS